MTSLPNPQHERSLGAVAVLIPAWRPPDNLRLMVAELRRHGFGAILIVDDGSGTQSAKMFESLAAGGAFLLRHTKNLGKGRALKTGFYAVMRHFPDARYIVTADADGQHTIRDILQVAEAMIKYGRPVLGSRRLGKVAPWRSRFGNTLTRSIFGLISGTRLRDTQTGLRALPTELLPELVALRGEGYEYEMTMLTYLCRNGFVPLEIDIETVYFNSNRESKFKPVHDSLQIYLALLQAVLRPSRKD